MNESTLTALTKVISSRFGLQPGPGWEAALRGGVARLGERLGCTGVEAAGLVVNDPEQLRELAGGLTIDESYFLRHREHFQAMASHIARRLSSGGRAPGLTVWSAGCSTGEEPYSAAIVLCERLGRQAADQVTILASDLSGESIAVALAGSYDRWSFRDVPGDFVSRNLAELPGGRFQVRAEHRRMVSFSHRAVQEHLPLLQPASVDVVLFRNVAIYLEPDGLGALWEGFARVLRPDGLLVVAPTDPRPPSPLFAGVDAGGTCVFAPAAGQRQRPAAAAARRAPRPGPVRSQRGAATPTLDHARRLGDQGRVAEALEAASRIAAAAPGDKRPLLLRGVLAMSASRFQQAVEDLRRALFIDGKDMLARFWYAQALHLAGRGPLALSQVRAVESWLQAVPEATLMDDGKTRADELLGAVRLLKESLE